MSRNNSFTRLTLLAFALLVLPAVAAAQSTGNCNQRPADPVVDFKIDGVPRFALPSNDGCWIYLRVDNFVESKTTASGVAVLRRENGAVRLNRFVPIPGVHDTMAFTPNQRMLLVQADQQIAVLDTSILTSGNGNPVLGYIRNAHFANKGGTQTGAMPVTRDGRYMFVSQHSLAWISILDLKKIEAAEFGASAVAGGFPTEPWPSGVVAAADGRQVFITSFPPESADAPLKCREYGSINVTDPLVAPAGAISVVDINKALSGSANPVVSAAGTTCHTAPLAASPDGKTLYTISHTDSTLLAFDASAVAEGGTLKQIGTVPVGRHPRDHIVVDEGRKVIVANSNQVSGTAQETETLTVIDTSKIRLGAEAVLGTVRVGADPRYLSVTADGSTLLVSNFKSKTLQLIDLRRLPLEPAKR